jgi:hypothetical protein
MLFEWANPVIFPTFVSRTQTIGFGLKTAYRISKKS